MIDNQEYGNSETDFPIMNLLLDIPEIREVWLNYKQMVDANE